MVGGDFNAILNIDERQGGSANNSGICKFLKSWFNCNDLSNLHFHDPRFIYA